MSETSTPVLFVSGAGLPPWIWDGVRAELTDHPTYVAPRPAGKDASLADHAAAALDEVPAERFVVVAHSAGGMVAAKLLELQPERVAGLLGVASWVPAPGASFVGSLPFPNRLVLSLMMRVLGTRPPEKALRAQAVGLSVSVADDLVRDFVPESQRYYRDPTGVVARPRRVGYVCTTEDQMPAKLQRAFADRLGVERPTELGTGHLPMLEDPGALRGVIESFARNTSGATPG